MPGYLTKQEDIAITGAADLIIQSLLDKQQFADPLGAAEALGISSAAWPLFGLLWPSGAQLAQRMASRPCWRANVCWRSAAAWVWPAWCATGAVSMSPPATAILWPNSFCRKTRA